jgi:predicted nucleic acid-binding protein
MRIIVDTCVISELLRARPAQSVKDWFDRFLPRTRLGAPVLMELEVGIALMRDPAAQAASRMKVARLLDRFDPSEFLLFDRPAAIAAAKALADARRSGRPLGVIDAEIIGVASATNSVIATRDSDFASRGVAIVNPWTDNP